MDGRRVTAEALTDSPLPSWSGRLAVLAMGKAATAMLAGAADVLGPRLGPCLAVTRADSVRPGEPGVPDAEVIFGDHPVPGAASLAAGRRVLGFCAGLDSAAPLLVLLSGGASALVEHPVAGVSAGDLARANRWLLASGLGIDHVNAVRRRLSAIKGGGLARHTGASRIAVLAISDVPGNAAEVIGSAPFTPSAAPRLPDGLPKWLLGLAAGAEAPSARRQVPAVDFRVVADAGLAARGALVCARSLGFGARLHDPLLSGRTTEAARRVVAGLDSKAPKIHAWRGETSPVLPATAGPGGRNRHLALCLALALERHDLRDVTALCTATDGSDGSAEAAGGWADGTTAARIRAAGLDPEEAFHRADSAAALAAAGDTFVTGPTGTNVMDLVLAFCAPGLSEQRRAG